MVEFAPTDRPDTYRRSFAGDSFNTAVYLARAGVSTRYLTRLGDDAGSAAALEAMRDEHIDCSLVARDSGANIGLYLIDNDDAGERSFSYYRDSSPARRLFDAPLEIQTATFYFTGITLAITGSGRANLLALLESLKGAGTQIVFDPNHRPQLWPDADEARRACLSVLPFCDLLLPTQDDDAQLWGHKTAAASIDFYRGQGAGEVVVKGADLRVVAWCDGDEAARQAEPVPALDTTGAGDAFNAAYLARRLAGADLASALACGQALAAQVVRHRGAILPALEEV